MTYEIATTDVDDSARHSVNLSLSSKAGDVVTVSVRRDGPIIRFQPIHLAMIWRWDFETEVWEMLNLSVDGFRLNKDGSINAQRIRDGKTYINRAGTQSDTPSQFLALVEKHQPTWKITKGAQA